MANSNDKQPKSWRDVLPIHPAAELFPRMSESELRELGEDIKKNGLCQRITFWSEKLGKEPFYLLDGGNRLDAMELVGLPLADDDGALAFHDWNVTAGEPYDLALSLNLHRRHLTGEQKRELIAKVLKAKPATSNRQIAKQVKADDKTVGKVRAELEATAEIPQLEKTVGKDGKSRKATRPPKTKKSAKLDPSIDKLFEEFFEDIATGSAEISEEQRRADMVRLDEPVEEAVDEVDRCVNSAAKWILIKVEDLSGGDAKRFFTALRDRIDDIEREKLRAVEAAS